MQLFFYMFFGNGNIGQELLYEVKLQKICRRYHIMDILSADFIICGYLY